MGRSIDLVTLYVTHVSSLATCATVRAPLTTSQGGAGRARGTPYRGGQGPGPGRGRGPRVPAAASDRPRRGGRPASRDRLPGPGRTGPARLGAAGRRPLSARHRGAAAVGLRGQELRSE